MFEGKVAVDLRGLAFDRISDGAVRRIAERIAAGERLGPADALAMYRSNDLMGLGTLADAINRAKNGDVVTFASNQHINPTNICSCAPRARSVGTRAFRRRPAPIGTRWIRSWLRLRMRPTG